MAGAESIGGANQRPAEQLGRSLDALQQFSFFDSTTRRNSVYGQAFKAAPKFIRPL
jgi:hypothetical protein